MTPSDHGMINLKTTVRADCVIFTCSPFSACAPLKLPFKSSCPLIVSGRGDLWTQVYAWPWLLASEIKQTFLFPFFFFWNKANFSFHQLRLFIGFWVQAARPQFWSHVNYLFWRPITFKENSEPLARYQHSINWLLDGFLKTGTANP